MTHFDRDAETRPATTNGSSAWTSRTRRFLVEWGETRRRAELARRQDLRWWLIYGQIRSGTSLMLWIVKSESRVFVSDWCLGPMLRLARDEPDVRFDRERALLDISKNILDNANRGGGTQLDLVFKQANLGPGELSSLQRMWGAPARRIYCFRKPSSYMPSAMKKFPRTPLAVLQQHYVRAARQCHEIGGDPFEYDSRNTEEDYRRFLAPLSLRDPLPIALHYGETETDKDTTVEMWNAYHELRARVPSAVADSAVVRNCGGADR